SARGCPPGRPRTGPAARAARPAFRARGPPRTASGHIPGPAPPSVLRRARGEVREIEFAQRLLDQLALVLLVERLASDLLGGHARQVGALLADVVERPLRSRFDFALRALGGLGQEALAMVLGLLFVGFGRLAGPLDDLVGLAARLLQALAVF